VVGTVVCHTGSSEDGERILRRLKTFSPLLMDSIGTMPYTSAQKLVNDSYPKGLQNYWKIELHRGDKRRGHRGSTIYWEGNRNAAERPCPPHPSGPPWSPHSIPCNLLNFNPELPQGPQNCGLTRGMRDKVSSWICFTISGHSPDARGFGARIVPLTGLGNGKSCSIRAKGD